MTRRTGGSLRFDDGMQTRSWLAADRCRRQDERGPSAARDGGPRARMPRHIRRRRARPAVPCRRRVPATTARPRRSRDPDGLGDAAASPVHARQLATTAIVICWFPPTTKCCSALIGFDGKQLGGALSASAPPSVSIHLGQGITGEAGAVPDEPTARHLRRRGPSPCSHPRRVHHVVVGAAGPRGCARRPRAGHRRRRPGVGRRLLGGVEGRRGRRALAVQRDRDRVRQAEGLAGEVGEGHAEPVRQEGEQVVAYPWHRRRAGGEQSLVGRQERRLDVDHVLAEHGRTAGLVVLGADRRLAYFLPVQVGLGRVELAAVVQHHLVVLGHQRRRPSAGARPTAVRPSPGNWSARCCSPGRAPRTGCSRTAGP